MSAPARGVSQAMGARGSRRIRLVALDLGAKRDLVLPRAPRRCGCSSRRTVPTFESPEGRFGCGLAAGTALAIRSVPRSVGHPRPFARDGPRARSRRTTTNASRRSASVNTAGRPTASTRGGFGRALEANRIPRAHVHAIASPRRARDPVRSFSRRCRLRNRDFLRTCNTSRRFRVWFRAAGKRLAGCARGHFRDAFSRSQAQRRSHAAM